MKHIREFSDGINVMKSSASDFRKLPHRNFDEPITGIESIVVVPVLKKDGLHDSGFRCMDFAAVHKGNAYCLLSGCSDVLHIGGISGFNDQHWRKIPDLVTPVAWSIDCLPSSGLLHIFCRSKIGNKIAVEDFPLSSFEIYPTK